MARILVVDDDKSVGAAIKMVLEVSGFEVTHVVDGASGIEEFKAGDFAVIMVDLFMPGIDGLETIRAFRQINSRAPIIAISGFMSRNGRGEAPDFLDMATKLGATTSLPKPFRPRELIDAVQSCLERGHAAGADSWQAAAS
jgi:DNA-binding response OmpR family regulator